MRLDIKQMLMRSGPCLDSLPLLNLYLAALEDPALKWAVILPRFKFTPGILEKIRAADLPPEEKGRLFSRAMTLFRSGSAYKTTAAGRSPLTDRALLQKVRPGDLVLETGVSDGSSAAGLLAAAGAEVLLSDRQVSFRYLDRGPARLFYDNGDGALGVKLPGFYLCTGKPAGHVPETAGAISILNPLLADKYPGAGLYGFDIFSGSLPRKANIIKCANVLNRAYFSSGQIKDGVWNLLKNLAPGGWLFIAQNNAGYKDGEAYVALQETGGRLQLRETVNGHEILGLLGSPAFAGIVAQTPELAAALPAAPAAEAVTGDLLHTIYRRLAGEHPGEGAKVFIRHLTWIGASFALAKVVSALVNIAAGRMLGPAEYGRITILVSVGTAIAPFMIAGLNNAVIRYGVDPAARAGVFTAAASITAALALAVSAFTLLFRPALSAFFGVTPDMMAPALGYALATSLFLLVTGQLQAAGEFSKRGITEIVFSAVLAAVFFAGVYEFGRHYQAMIYAYIAAFGGLGLYWLFSLSRSMKPVFPPRAKLGEVVQYGAYSFGGGLGYYLTANVQGVILNSYLGPEKVGVYAAYSTATIGIAAYLGYAISTVLFPKASASTNRKRLWEMAVRGWLRLAPLAVLFFIAAEAAVLALMGRHQYGMQPRLMVLFALGGTIMLIHSSLAQIIFSEGVRASRLSLFMTWGGGLVNFTACLLLIPVFNVGGAAIAFILSYAVLLFWFWKVKDRYLQPSGRSNS